MNEHALWLGYQVVGAALVALGIVGFLARRNLIVMFLAVEMMLQGVALSLVGWGRYHGTLDGQVLVLFVLTVAACEAALAMALALMLFQRRGHLDTAACFRLHEPGQEAQLVEEVSPEGELEEPEPEPAWPHLPPAGVEPQRDPEQEAYRSHV